MSYNAQVINRRIILTAEQLSSRQQQSNELLQAELANRNENLLETLKLQEMDENESYLLGYN